MISLVDRPTNPESMQAAEVGNTRIVPEKSCCYLGHNVALHVLLRILQVDCFVCYQVFGHNISHFFLNLDFSPPPQEFQVCEKC